MITKINKRRLIGLSFIICHLSFSVAISSCSDMLETDSERQVFDPELNQKTDSLFYAYGILQAMQQLADQYVFQGEMRGDLVKTTEYTDSMLRHLAQFTVTTSNRYDSAYVYYRVINNCNYYIAHRDTALYTGATNVAINEYAGVKAIRAWAYLQLVRNYGRVPFFTEPLTKISQIDNNSYPEVDMAGLVSQLAPDLEPFTGYATTDFGNFTFSVGAINSSNSTKTVQSSKLMMPVDVVLGDLYLENHQYSEAATHYITYLTKVAPATGSPFFSAYTTGRRGGNGGSNGADTDRPSDWDQTNNRSVTGASEWASIFTSTNNTADIITYIPMAVNRTLGQTTDVPLAFGYNYYATQNDVSLNGGLYVDEVQIEPSESYLTLSDSTDYYYYVQATTGLPRSEIKSSKLGDQRVSGILRVESEDNITRTWIRKYENANIIIYRTSTVLLHLAEALNRLGMPDAAFAILKDGIGAHLLEPDAAYYMTDATKQALQSTYPLLSEANISRFEAASNRIGIHMHGAGMTRDYNGQDYVSSPYRLDTIVGLKLREIAKQYQVISGHQEIVEDTLGLKHNVFVWDTQLTKQDSINAVEDILCDEYALELAFEGCRFFDLCRLARHKNQTALYGPNFGSIWLARKLAYKKPAVNLEQESNWYLPFK